MKGSEFLARYGGKGPAVWDAAVLQAARDNALVEWPWVPVNLEMPGHSATVKVTSDYVAVGTPSDHIRTPIRPDTAQSIANLYGMLLPTRWLVRKTWEQAPLKLTPVKAGLLSAKQNLGPAAHKQFAEHDQIITNQLQGREGKLTSGQKKDLVVSNIMQPGKVIIYGWFYPDVNKPYHETFNPTDIAKGIEQPVQALSNVHGIDYYDYSHGVRLVAPTMVVDDKEVPTESVYTSAVLSKLVSDEGPLRATRYPSPVPVAPIRPAGGSEYVSVLDQVYRGRDTESLTDRGVAAILPPDTYRRRGR